MIILHGYIHNYVMTQKLCEKSGGVLYREPLEGIMI